MTAVRTLVSTLRAAGIRLVLLEGRVRVEAAPGVLTDPDRAALRAHRDAVRMLLQSEAETLLVGAAAARAIIRALAPDGRGGIVVMSRVLGGRRVLFVRDETVPVPEPYRELVRFTRAELEQAVAESWSAECLRDVVMVKEVMGGGTVVSPPATDRMAAVDVRAIGATGAPLRVDPTLEDLCDERQGWCVRFPARGPEDA